MPCPGGLIGFELVSLLRSRKVREFKQLLRSTFGHLKRWHVSRSCGGYWWSQKLLEFVGKSSVSGINDDLHHRFVDVELIVS